MKENLNSVTKVKLAQIAFLTETAQFYNSTNRGVKPGSINSCSYGACCAIGRKLTPELRKELDEIVLSEGDGCVNSTEVFEKLPEWMKQLRPTFLRVVQVLHDMASNWDKNGLSKTGWENYQRYLEEVLEETYIG